MKWDKRNEGWKYDTWKEIRTGNEEDYIAIVFYSSQSERPSFDMLVNQLFVPTGTQGHTVDDCIGA